jgi:hypothetical protein
MYRILTAAWAEYVRGGSWRCRRAVGRQEDRNSIEAAHTVFGGAKITNHGVVRRLGPKAA